MLKFRLIKLKRISNQTKVQIVFNLCKSEITDIKKHLSSTYKCNFLGADNKQ